MVGGAIEWWDTRQDDVGDNTAGPDVALGSIILGKHFRSDVIWSSELFVEFLSFLKHERGSEINNLDLVEFLVRLKKNVLRFKIPVDDMICVAIVDAPKDLLH